MVQTQEEWSSEIPKEPGFYWWKPSIGSDDWTDCLKITEKDRCYGVWKPYPTAKSSEEPTTKE